LSFTTPPAEHTPDAPAVETAAPRPARPAWRVWAREILETILLTVVIYAVVNFATQRFKVEGDSMQPNLHPNEYVLVDRLSYRLGQPQRGDIVVFHYPLATERDFIKRVIGLPDETVAVANGVVTVNGQPLDEPYIAAPPGYANTWLLGPDQYFVLGDNRNNSSDSHNWGPLDRQYLIGKAVLIYWPPSAWGLVPHYTYPNLP
jgi:signal peptidase I